MTDRLKVQNRAKEARFPNRQEQSDQTHSACLVNGSSDTNQDFPATGNLLL
jgi:hypothetical protein